MEPTLSEGDVIIVSRYHYKFFKPKRREIVLIDPASGVFSKGTLAHRVIAVSGDRVIIANDRVAVNGDEIEYSVLNNARPTDLVVPRDNIFQKGDNPETRTYGLVNQEFIVGKVLFYF